MVQLGEPPRAVDGVHDLEVGGVARHRPQQPVAPEACLLGGARLDQRVDGERGVAQPAVAVVPVALAAEVLRQRGRRRRHDAAGVDVGHQVQRQQGAAYDVSVRDVGEVEPGDPGDLVVDRLVDQRRMGTRCPEVRRQPRGRERQDVALADVEVVDVTVAGGLRQAGTAQDELVRPGHGGDRRLVTVLQPPADPRAGGAVLEAHHPLVVHPHGAPHAGDPPHDVDPAVAGGHHVEQGDHAGVGTERRLQRRRVLDVRPRDLVVADRAQLPVPVLLVAEKCREAGGRVEAGEAQPVDRAVPPDQGCGAPVADHRVVLDRPAHGRDCNPAH